MMRVRITGMLATRVVMRVMTMSVGMPTTREEHGSSGVARGVRWPR